MAYTASSMTDEYGPHHEIISIFSEWFEDKGIEYHCYYFGGIRSDFLNLDFYTADEYKRLTEKNKSAQICVYNSHGSEWFQVEDPKIWDYMERLYAAQLLADPYTAAFDGPGDPVSNGDSPAAPGEEEA